MAEKDGRAIAPRGVGGILSPPQGRFVQHVVVQQRRGVDVLDRPGQHHGPVSRRLGAAEARGDHQQQRPDALAAAGQDVERDLVDQGHAGIDVFGDLDVHVVQIGPSGLLEPKTSKAAPNYPDIMPRQQLIESQTITLAGRKALQAVKTYTPGYVIVEIGVDVEDILTEPLFELHTELIDACRRVLGRLDGDPQFQEEYRVYCVSNYTGDPEVFLTLHGERFVGLLKDERLPLDEEEG